jgi:hypothetical protein
MANTAFFQWTRVIAQAIHRALIDATEHIVLPTYDFDVQADDVGLRQACKLLNYLDFDGISSTHSMCLRLRYAIATGLREQLAKLPRDDCLARIAVLEEIASEAPETASSAVIRGIVTQLKRWDVKLLKLDSRREETVRPASEEVIPVEDELGVPIIVPIQEEEKRATESVTLVTLVPESEPGLDEVFGNFFMLRENFSDLYNINESRRLMVLLKELYRIRRGFIKLGQEKVIEEECKEFFVKITSSSPRALANNETLDLLLEPLRAIFETMMAFCDPFEITSVTPQDSDLYTTRMLPDGTYVMMERKVELIQRQTLWAEFAPIFQSLRLALQAYGRFFALVFGSRLITNYLAINDTDPTRAGHTLHEANETVYRNGFRLLCDNLHAAWFNMAQFFVEHFSSSIKHDIELLRGELDSHLTLA